MDVDFIELSYDLGADPNLVQGAGGNTSLKDNNIMHIKASGKWLSNSKKEDIFVSVDLEKIRSHIKNKKSNLLDDITIAEEGLRPSIETTLHALMPHKVVLHTHPVELLSWLVRANIQDQLIDLLKGFSCVWVPYTRPGSELTQAVQKALKGICADVILLGNHGLVVGGENCIEARNLMKKIVNRCSVKTKSMDYKISSSLEELAANLKMRLPKHDEVHAIALNDVFYDYCTNETGILYPDQAVFLGPSMPCYRGELDHKNFVDFVKQYEKSPFLIIKGKGVLVANDAKIDVDEMLRCHVRVLSHIPNESKLNYLTGIEVARLLDWEPEKYRLSLEE